MFDLLRSDNLHYLLWFGDGHTTRGSFVPSGSMYLTQILLGSLYDPGGIAQVYDLPDWIEGN